MINNETARFGYMGDASSDPAEQARRQAQMDERTAADAADAYAESMRQQALAMRQGEADRGAAITEAYKTGTPEVKQAIAEKYQLTATQMNELRPIWEKPIFWIGTSAGAGLLLYLVFRRPSPAGRFGKK